MERNLEVPFPDKFVEFLKENGLDASMYTMAELIPRYIRLKPGVKIGCEKLEADLGVGLMEVDWLPNFFALPPHIQIAKSDEYQKGMIYGIDAASGAAVTALGICKGDHVIDLCAAPGAKLCMILDLLGDSGSVTGVDISRHRLAACITILQKYSLGDRCRLFVADGTEFFLPPLCSDSCELVHPEEVDVFGEWSLKKAKKVRRRLSRLKEKIVYYAAVREHNPELLYYGRHSGVVGITSSELYEPELNSTTGAYDKVLVDAECTHDGSFKHVQKFENWGWETIVRRLLNAERTDSLTALQLRLLSNGFRLLKIGGSLIYSTCSLTVAQNEGVVEKFLQQNACARLEEIDVAKNWPCESGLIPKTVRFDPRASRTSGLFIAKFTKSSLYS